MAADRPSGTLPLSVIVCRAAGRASAGGGRRPAPSAGPVRRAVAPTAPWRASPTPLAAGPAVPRGSQGGRIGRPTGKSATDETAAILRQFDAGTAAQAHALLALLGDGTGVGIMEGTGRLEARREVAIGIARAAV